MSLFFVAYCTSFHYAIILRLSTNILRFSLRLYLIHIVATMPHTVWGTQHHCPLRRRKGNCRMVHSRASSYCSAHQELCAVHPGTVKVIGEDCMSCIAAQRATDRANRKAREESQKSKALDNQPKKYGKKNKKGKHKKP